MEAVAVDFEGHVEENKVGRNRSDFPVVRALRYFLAPKKNTVPPFFPSFFSPRSATLLLVLTFEKFFPRVEHPFLQVPPHRRSIMGTGKKEATRKERQGKIGDGMGNVRTKGENFYRYVQSTSSVVVAFRTID